MQHAQQNVCAPLTHAEDKSLQAPVMQQQSQQEARRLMVLLGLEQLQPDLAL